jgi:dTDP-4-amino-4,6-dideoxygalactose transaminase
MKVPFLDLKAQYKQIEHDVVPMIKEAMENAMFIGGPNVEGFEKEFADFCNTRFCVGVNSGTDALRFVLMAVGVGSGDEVITVPNTFIATTEAISQVGATPVFVDVDPDSCNMDPVKLKEFMEQECSLDESTGELINHSTKRPVKAAIPVHLYGQPADMDPILEITGKYGITVIEDACQAHGALYKGKKAGSMSAAGCFSFYPGKNLGACGEGGAVVTDDEDIAGKIRMIRDHGQAKKYFHDMEGYNGRLDAIQAGVLRIKLKRLSEWNQSRQENAAYYDELLTDTPGVESVKISGYAESVYHLYVIMVDERDKLQQFLTDRGIATGLHYPLPLHLQKAYDHLGYREGAFPITETAAKRLLSLPMYPELKREQIEYVTDTIKEFMSKDQSGHRWTQILRI